MLKRNLDKVRMESYKENRKVIEFYKVRLENAIYNKDPSQVQDMLQEIDCFPNPNVMLDQHLRFDIIKA